MDGRGGYHCQVYSRLNTKKQEEKGVSKSAAAFCALRGGANAAGLWNTLLKSVERFGFLRYNGKTNAAEKSLFPDMVQTLFDDGKHMGIQQGIIDRLSFTSVFHKTVLF